MKGGGCARVTSGVVTISPGTVSEYSDHQGPDAEGPGDSLWWKAVFERKPREQRDHSWGCCCHTHTHRKVKKTRLVPGHQNLTQVHERPPFINRWDNTAPLPGFEFKSTTCFFFFFFLSWALSYCHVCEQLSLLSHLTEKEKKKSTNDLLSPRKLQDSLISITLFPSYMTLFHEKEHFLLSFAPTRESFSNTPSLQSSIWHFKDVLIL